MRLKNMAIGLALASLPLAAIGAAQAQPPAGSASPARPPAAPPALTDELKRRTFDQVWQTMQDRYFDRTFGGLDWAAIREEYRPRAMNARNHVEFHEVLAEMVKRLDASHVSVTPPVLPNAPIGNLTAVGIELFAGGQRALVQGVEPNSAAAQAGIVPGDEILSVDGVSVADLAAQHARGRKPESRSLAVDQLWLAVHRKLRGAPGTEVTVRVRTAQGERDLRLRRAVSTTHGRGGRHGFRLLEPGIGLLSLLTFYTDIDALIAQTFSACRSCSALIIDLRGNGGGFAHNITRLLDRIMDRPGVAGLSLTATGEEALRFSGTGAEAFRGEIFVLVDGRSASSSEVVAAAIQDQRRGRVIGTRTAGAVLLSEVQALPTGGEQLLPFAEFRRSTRLPLEEVGAVPDISVVPLPSDIAAGRDLALDIARWLAGQSKGAP